MTAIVCVVIVLLILCWLIGSTCFQMACARNVRGLASKIISAATTVSDTADDPRVTAGRDFWKSAEKELVEIKSYDGLTLRGEYYKSPEAVRSIILVHGYRATGIANFAAVLRVYGEMNCNILLIDQRGCGKSDGDYICFGMKERIDVQSWANWLYEKDGGALPVFLDGISLGGATVLMASNLKFPPNVKGIISDSGYTNGKEILAYVLKEYLRLPAFPIIPLTNLVSRIKLGMPLDKIDSRNCLGSTSLPVYFFHGQADRFVPAYMGEANYDACASDKKMYISPTAEHGMAYMENPNECLALINELFDKYGGL